MPENTEIKNISSTNYQAPQFLSREAISLTRPLLSSERAEVSGKCTWQNTYFTAPRLWLRMQYMHINMNMLICKYRDYTLQSNNSNIKTMLLLKYPASVTALISMYINTYTGSSIFWKSGLDKILGQVGGRTRRHQSACKILEKCSP